MQAGQLILVRTNPATQLRGSLAQNAALTLDIPMVTTQADGDGYVTAGLAAGRTVRGKLKAISIWSVENLLWEVWLWGRDTYNTPTVVSGGLAPLGRWAFPNLTDGVRIAAAGAYFYYKEGLDVAYEDMDSTSEVHLMLINRSAGAKSADDAGAIQLQLAFEPTYGI